jgi:hypothetical protein
MGLMSVAKPMIQNVFTDAMPALGRTLIIFECSYATYRYLYNASDFFFID